MQNSISSPVNGSGQMTALRWISVALSALIIVMAFMIGEALFGGQMDLVKDHGYLGSGIFVLAVIQLGLTFLQFQKGTVSRNILMLNGLLIILLFAQIGLGYSGTSGTPTAIVYHIPLGVLLMSVSTIIAMLFWTRPNRTAVTA